MGTAILAMRWSRLSLLRTPERRVRDHSTWPSEASKNEVDFAEL